MYLIILFLLLFIFVFLILLKLFELLLENIALNYSEVYYNNLENIPFRHDIF
jgi:hypothetical protein